MPQVRSRTEVWDKTGVWVRVTRKELIARFIDEIVKDLGHESIESYLRRGIVDEQLIQRVSVEFIAKRNEGGHDVEEVVAEFPIEIDWERHALHLRVGEDERDLDMSRSTVEQISSKVAALVLRFQVIGMARGARTRVVWWYRTGVDAEQARQKTGGAVAEDIPKAGGGIIFHLQPKELDELKMTPAIYWLMWGQR